MNAPRDTSYDDSLLHALADPKEAAAYLDAVMEMEMEMEDAGALMLALRQVAKAHGMAEVTRRADVGEKTLFRVLSDKGNPTIETLNKVLHALGLRLSVAPLPA
jgi:probable addiction module antidote protein